MADLTTPSGTVAAGDPGEPPVQVDRLDHTLVITLNRPAAMNAVNAALAVAVAEALQAADADAGVRAVVVTGAGDRAFCAGADLKAVARGETIIPAGYERFGFAGYVSHFVSKPTIAAVRGFALGGGTEIALASDLVIAGKSASFGLPEVKRGIYAGAGGAFRLPEQLPWKVALELLFTGDSIDADTAARYGLVNRVVPDADVLAEALALAGRIAANAPLSVQTSKRLAYGAVDGTVAADAPRWEHNARESAALMASADAKEGPTAFAEKRTPVWQGQ